MTYWQLCYFMNFHFTFSTHTNVIYIYLDGIKFSAQGLNQSFVIKLANPGKPNWTLVPNSFQFSLNWLALLPYLVCWASTQHPHVGHDRCLQPLSHCLLCTPLAKLFLTFSDPFTGEWLFIWFWYSRWLLGFSLLLWLIDMSLDVCLLPTALGNILPNSSPSSLLDSLSCGLMFPSSLSGSCRYKDLLGI